MKKKKRIPKTTPQGKIKATFLQLRTRFSLKGYLLLTESSFVFIHFDFLFEYCPHAIACVI